MVRIQCSVFPCHGFMSKHPRFGVSFAFSRRFSSPTGTLSFRRLESLISPNMNFLFSMIVINYIEAVELFLSTVLFFSFLSTSFFFFFISLLYIYYIYLRFFFFLFCYFFLFSSYFSLFSLLTRKFRVVLKAIALVINGLVF